jgi:hypothetical protein
MKMSSQSRSFVKQVQVDLLALSDADLFHTVHQWVEMSDSSGLSLDVLEDIRSALGYTRVLAETKTLSHLLYDMSETDNKSLGQWLAPSPHHLRTLLTTMDINLFAQYVITLAFQSLHTTYPQWYDGGTFNAHLANYLRHIKRRTTAKGQGINT